MKRFLWAIFILTLLGIVGYVIYLKWFKTIEHLEAWSAVPKESLFVIESDEPIRNWNEWSSAEPWQLLKTHPFFAEMGKQATYLDSLLAAQKTLIEQIGEHPLLISGIPISNRDFDFLYIVDLGNAAKLDFLDQSLGLLFKAAKQQVTTSDFGGQTISHAQDPETKDILHVTILANQLICSYTQSLVEKAITQSKTPYYAASNTTFTTIHNRVSGSGTFRCYFPGPQLPVYMGLYGIKTPELDALGNMITFGGFSLITNPSRLTFDGALGVNDSNGAWLSALLKQGNGISQLAGIMPQRTGFFFSIHFTDFKQFFSDFQQFMQERDSAGLAQFKKTKAGVEKWLGVTLESHFISWIGDEILYGNWQPVDSLPADYLMLIHPNNLEEAKKQLADLEKRIKRRTPLKVSTEEYKGHEIKYLNVKGLFNVLLGKLFKKVERPYYAVVDGQLVFAGTELGLQQFIDAQEGKLTLGESDTYTTLMDAFNDRGSLFVYLNTPRFLPFSAKYVGGLNQKKMLKQQSWYNAFAPVGLQLTAYDTWFGTTLSASFVKPDQKPVAVTQDSSLFDTTTTDFYDSLSDTEKEIIDNIADEQDVGEYPSGKTQWRVKLKDGKRQGKYLEYWENGHVRVKGQYEEGEKTGVWKYYNEDGTFKEKQTF